MADGDKPAPKKGRKPILDPELVAASLADLNGNVVAVAKRYGVHRSSVQELIEKRPALQRVCKDAREGMKDNAESALYKAVLDGEAWAVCFFLKTQAKDRGYIEKAPEPPPPAPSPSGVISIEDAVRLRDDLARRDREQLGADVSAPLPVVPEGGAAVGGVPVPGG